MNAGRHREDTPQRVNVVCDCVLDARTKVHLIPHTSPVLVSIDFGTWFGLYFS